MTKRLLLLVGSALFLLAQPSDRGAAEQLAQTETAPAALPKTPAAAAAPESPAAAQPEGAAAPLVDPATEEAAPVPTVATVHVTVENVEAGQGTVWLALCDTDLSVEGCPDRMSVPASDELVEVTFENVPPGIYAVAGYQDLNGDDEFDKFFGVPREPYALSGAAGEQLVPTFDSAAQAFAAGDNAVTIRMKRLIGG